MTRITLIHATALSMAPINQSFADLWPGADTPHLLDESLSRDHAQAGKLTPAMRARFEMLANYAVFSGADGILFTCSAFGPAIASVQERLTIPVLKPNEAMFRDAIATGGRIVMLVTFAPSVASLMDEFTQMTAGRDIEVEPVLVEGAMEALGEGRGDVHDRMIAEAAALSPDADTILLAQFSMARAFTAVTARVTVPVLTAPQSAVSAMRSHFD